MSSQHEEKTPDKKRRRKGRRKSSNGHVHVSDTNTNMAAPIASSKDINKDIAGTPLNHNSPFHLL